MILEKLEIERKTWGEDKGKHFGVVRFSNDLGSVNLKLNTEQCNEIFRICADGVLTVAKEAADNMTCNIIEHTENLKLEDKLK